MKKFLVVCLSLICLMFTFGLTACEDKNELVDLANCEIGYELSVYPQCEFTYKAKDRDNNVYEFQITSISASLIEKNEINKDDEVSGNFYRYTINISADATTSSTYVGKTFNLCLTWDFVDCSSVFAGTAQVDSSGKIHWDYNKYVNRYAYELIFRCID